MRESRVNRNWRPRSSWEWSPISKPPGMNWDFQSSRFPCSTESDYSPILSSPLCGVCRPGVPWSRQKATLVLSENHAKDITWVYFRRTLNKTTVLKIVFLFAFLFLISHRVFVLLRYGIIYFCTRPDDCLLGEGVKALLLVSYHIGKYKCKCKL